MVVLPVPWAMLAAPAATIDFNPINEAEQIVISSGADIHHGFDGAFYVPSRDQICLPVRERFTTPENYYATALHELTPLDWPRVTP